MMLLLIHIRIPIRTLECYLISRLKMKFRRRRRSCHWTCQEIYHFYCTDPSIKASHTNISSIRYIPNGSERPIRGWSCRKRLHLIYSSNASS